MPVILIKKSEWCLDYYLLQGYCTSAELVKAIQEATLRPLERAVTVFDLLEGELDMEQEDIKQIIAINKRLFESGKINTHAAILTQSQTLKLFGEAFELMSSNQQTKLNSFLSLKDGLAWLGLAEHEYELQEILKNFRKK